MARQEGARKPLLSVFERHAAHETVTYDENGCILVRSVHGRAKALKRIERRRRRMPEQVVPTDGNYRERRSNGGDERLR